jgi:hypothetical protein
LEIPSARLNEWKSLINDTQQPLPSPRLSSSERQRLWKGELEQELSMKREEKRKQLAKQGSPMSPTNSKGLQPPASRLATASQILATSSHLRIRPDTPLCSLLPILVHGDGLSVAMYFPSAGCKVFLSLSVCSVSFSVDFYVCDLLYSLLRLSFGEQDQLPIPTWQWVTLAPVFGSFILYLLVNKIRVFVHLWIRQFIVVEGFHFLWFDFWHITIFYWTLLKVGIPAQIMKLLLSFLCTVYLLLHRYW